jgi:hypothetical protein
VTDDVIDVEAEVIGDDAEDLGNPAVQLQKVEDFSNYIPQIRMAEADVIELYEARKRIIKAVMVPGLDYGEIPGCPKPVLFQPGAQKLQAIYSYGMVMEEVEAIKEWGGGDPEKAFFSFTYRVGIGPISHDGTVHPIAWCEANANSYEKKWGKRRAGLACPSCGAPAIIRQKAEKGGGFICVGNEKGGCWAKFAKDDSAITEQPQGYVANEEIFGLVNTIQKMTQKRAMVGAVLQATGMSAFFTQDVEDNPSAHGMGGREKQQVPKSQPNQVDDMPPPDEGQWDTPAPSQPRKLNDEEFAKKKELQEIMVAAGVGVPKMLNHLKKPVAEGGLAYPKDGKMAGVIGDVLTHALEYAKGKLAEKQSAEAITADQAEAAKWAAENPGADPFEDEPQEATSTPEARAAVDAGRLFPPATGADTRSSLAPPVAHYNPPVEKGSQDDPFAGQ